MEAWEVQNLQGGPAGWRPREELPSECRRGQGQESLSPGSSAFFCPGQHHYFRFSAPPHGSRGTDHIPTFDRAKGPGRSKSPYWASRRLRLECWGWVIRGRGTQRTGHVALRGTWPPISLAVRARAWAASGQRAHHPIHTALCLWDHTLCGSLTIQSKFI